MKDRLTNVLERFFIQEPAMFQVLCVHEFTPNITMRCPLRCGLRRIEYNPKFVLEMSDKALEEALRTEAIRILLKHPYERKPLACSQQAISIGSNLVVGDNYNFTNFNIEHPSDFQLESGLPYEVYCRKIQEMLPPSDESVNEKPNPFSENANQNTDLSELWEEDDLSVSLINGIIQGCEDWGSLAGNLVEKLKASTRAKINWRQVFSGFGASILSSRKSLTRMKPSRRYGFEQMGSKRDFDTRLLIAVDVSGSISSQALSYFYGVINSAFRYGFEQIDVIQFDDGIRVVDSLKNVMRNVSVLGRGGTSFQEPVDYAHAKGYDGLVILTDGYAPQPVMPDNMRTKILWVCENQACYEKHHCWMEKSGRVCTIELK